MNLPDVEMVWDPNKKCCSIKKKFEFKLKMKRYLTKAGKHYGGKYEITKRGADKVKEHEQKRVDRFKNNLTPVLTAIEAEINALKTRKADTKENCFALLQKDVDAIILKHQNKINDALRNVALIQTYIGLKDRFITPPSPRDPNRPNYLDWPDYLGNNDVFDVRPDGNIWWFIREASQK